MTLTSSPPMGAREKKAPAKRRVLNNRLSLVIGMATDETVSASAQVLVDDLCSFGAGLEICCLWRRARSDAPYHPLVNPQSKALRCAGGVRCEGCSSLTGRGNYLRDVTWGCARGASPQAVTWRAFSPGWHWLRAISCPEREQLLVLGGTRALTCSDPHPRGSV